MKNILFRADADQNIGYGHFIRTLALADMLKDDFECVFCTQTPTEYQKNELSSVCPFMAFPADDSKFNLFLEQLKGDEIVVLDNYFFTSEYESQIREKGCKVVLIDNLHRRHTCADAVLGFLVGLEEKEYSTESYTRLYLGPSYTLLRRPFLKQLQVPHLPVKDYKKLNVVVSFGGSDSSGVAVALTNLLAESYCVNQVTLIGNFKNGLSDNKKIVFKSKLSAQEMCDEFATNDVAILPASTTMLEALASGIKIIGGYFVDNQIENYNQYVKVNACIGCGDLLNEDNRILVKKIIENELQSIQTQQAGFIPANVKDNILSIFREMSTQKEKGLRIDFKTPHFEFINYVNLTEEESHRVWEGRNHPEVRKWMVNSEPFSFESHKSFINGLKEREDRLYWAVKYDGELIGSFSLHPYDGEKLEGEMGKYLFFEARGKGLGKLATQEFIDAIFSNGIVHRVYIKTLISNTTNQHVNEAAGFVKYDTDDKYVYMELIK